MARALVARGGARAARRARRGGDRRRRRDVPGDPDEPGASCSPSALPVARRRRRAARDRGRRRRAAARRDGHPPRRSSATPRVRARLAGARRARSRVVASPRVRNQATVGGVLADADYASDPPAVLQALGARAVLRSPRGERAVPVERADPRLLRDVHRAGRAARRGAGAGRARAGRVPQVPLALERGPAVRRRRGGARRASGCGSSSAPSPRRRRSSPTCARSRRRAIDARWRRDRPRATPSGSSRSATRAARRRTGGA